LLEIDGNLPHMGSTPSKDSLHHSRALILQLSCLLTVVVLSFGIYSLRYDLRSYSFLSHFINPQATGPLLRWESHAITTQEVNLAMTGGNARGRLYLPTGVTHPPGMIVVPGIHHLGIDEPRLINFSRAASGSGFAVLTPEVAALADYRVDASSIPTIGESAGWLENHLGTGPVTIVGVSFAGSLSLLAACDPRYAPHMRVIVLMGAYGDLGRVTHFLATNDEELPGGGFVQIQAHDYGASVFVYSHMEKFFAASDIPVAHQALRNWLWEEPEKAQPLLDQLSPQGRATMEHLMMRQIDQLRPQMLTAIAADQAQMAALSPSGKLGNLRVPVFVLHGSADDIIPSTESLWLEKEIPAEYLRQVLITPAFSHVDPDQHAALIEDIRLVRFLARILRAAE
jgi:pimeloyl-ACP methyl ester carboxylesterase